jgi:hypothetical protein
MRIRKYLTTPSSSEHPLLWHAPPAAWITALLLIATIAGCSKKPAPLPVILPENIMARPIGTVGVVTLAEPSNLAISMRALGVPYRRIPIDSILRVDLDDIRMLFLDEGIMEDQRILDLYPRLIEIVGRGMRLVILQQQPALTAKMLQKSRQVIVAREVDHSINLKLPRPGHPLVASPNIITAADLDSLSRFAHQLARGSADARALIAGNVERPDSSAALLWNPLGRGALYYVAFPLTARSALGYAAEQRVLANLVSNAL